MMRYVVGVRLTVAAWREAVSKRFPRNDLGALTTEAVILTALLGGAAVALVGYITGTVLTDWQAEIPLSGG